jgi:hypothetical protein
MRGARLLVVVAVLLSALAACNSDDGSAGWGFRNLGKRGDANLAGEHVAAAQR